MIDFRKQNYGAERYTPSNWQTSHLRNYLLKQEEIKSGQGGLCNLQISMTWTKYGVMWKNSSSRVCRVEH